MRIQKLQSKALLVFVGCSLGLISAKSCFAFSAARALVDEVEGNQAAAYADYYADDSDDDIEALSKQITQGASSDMEKARLIHDWVATNIQYDPAVAASGKVTSMSDEDAEDTLHKKSGVCGGYAALTLALLEDAGIQAKFVIGTTTSSADGGCDHAWNKALVDGNWILIDTTWDSHDGYAGEDYFDPTPSDFALDHTAECSESD